MNSENKRIFNACESDAGLRVDKFLASRMPEFSRSEIQKMIDGKYKPAGKVHDGDVFRIEIPEQQTTTLDPQASDLDILYEDEDIIAVNKPRGVVMYPAAGNPDGTLVQMVLAHCGLSALGDANRPGVVHRIDKGTSGAVIFAKTDAAHRALTKTFAAHDLVRKYVCLCWGVPQWEGADITGNIGRSAKNRQKMTIVKIGGRPAKTHADVMAAWPRKNASELKCTLFTGRTHQIRVHLSAHGFPIICDPVYGRDKIGTIKDSELLDFVKNNNEQMLHAQYLELTHPVKGIKIKIKAPLPDDMRLLRDILDN
ncbi:MAG: RluA family pseudouridine synthase [Rickettsiales bacterium]|jgi:23S rRNA pseudouridine1911/1915/1917 synthase|nr:RluA family pseudouridine synthase [Rickettsiales bacterium]